MNDHCEICDEPLDLVDILNGITVHAECEEEDED